MVGKIQKFIWAMRPEHPFPRSVEENDSTYIARYTLYVEALAADCIDSVHELIVAGGALDGVRQELEQLLALSSDLSISENMSDSICRNAMRLIRYRCIAKVLEELPKSEKRQSPKKEENNSPEKSCPVLKVVSGTQGLADFLGCGKTKAFEIIKSGVLKAEGIQYQVGKTWKFNAEKLEKYCLEHPEGLK